MASSVKEGVADSLNAAGSATAPGAGAAIATIAAPPAGKYKITAEAFFAAGAPAAAEDANIAIRVGAANILKKLAVPRALNVLGVTSEDVYVHLDGSSAVALVAVGAATAAVVYVGSVLATRVA